MKITHFVSYDAVGGRFKAFAYCGALVHRQFDHSPHPTCEECQKQMARYEALALDQDEPDLVKVSR